MPEIVVAAQSRTEYGKNVNKRLRVAGRIPAVVYGAGKKAEHVSVSPKELAGILRSASGENSLIDLEVEGKRRKVIVKDYVVDPIKGKLLHADFYEVAMDKALHLPVHIELVGTAIGVKLGGQIDFVTRSVEVACLPGDIPEKLAIDVAAMQMGDVLRVSDIPVPKGVRILAEPTLVVVHVEAPRAEEAAPEAAAAAPAAGAAAAPAADAKKADAKAPEKKAPEKKSDKK